MIVQLKYLVREKLISLMQFPETLLRLNQIDSKEKINIITNTMKYSINKSLAAAISPVFLKIIKANPMIKEINLPIDENIEEFFKGKSIDSELFLIMSIIIDNKEFCQKSREESVINKEKAINRFTKFIKYNVPLENMKEEIQFIGGHFEELENQIEFDKIPSKYFSEIIQKAKGIKTEENIFKYILKRVKLEEDDSNRKKLIENIDLRGLSNKDIKELIENIQFEDLSEQLYSIMKKKILLINEWEKYEENEDISMFFLNYQQNQLYKKDPTGFSPLHYAVMNKSKGIGEILIRKGADINAKDIINQFVL